MSRLSYFFSENHYLDRVLVDKLQSVPQTILCVGMIFEKPPWRTRLQPKMQTYFYGDAMFNIKGKWKTHNGDIQNLFK